MRELRFMIDSKAKVTITGCPDERPIVEHELVGPFVGHELTVTRVRLSPNPGVIVHFKDGSGREGQIVGRLIRGLNGQKPPQKALSSSMALRGFLARAGR